MVNPWSTPLIIEAAISPLRVLGETQVFTTEELIQQARSCFAVGAGIVHHHHDFALDVAGTADEMMRFGQGVLATYPDALFYGDYVNASAFDEKMGHLPVLEQSNTLRMIAVDPGVASFGGLDDDGLPFTLFTPWTTFEEANRLADYAKRIGVPLSVGVFEPGMLRWAVAQARRNGLPAGSLVKLYLSGDRDPFRPNRAAFNAGLPPTPAAIEVLLEMLGDCGLPWQVSVLGGVIHEMPLARYVIEKGGHIRTGVEDAGGLTDATNAECVSAVQAIAEAAGRPVVTGADVLRTLKGEMTE